MITVTRTGRIVATALAITVGIALAGCTATTSASPTSSASCKPKHVFPTVQPGKLTVAAINAPPKFFATSATGPYTGIDGEIITQFASENCLTLDLKPLTGAAAVLDLTAGKSDIMIGGILKSAARAKQFGQTAGQLTYETMGIGSKDGVGTIDGLKGRKVGVQAGSSYTAALQAAIGADNVVEYQTDTNAFQDLAAGRIGATVLTGLQSWYDAKQFPGTKSELVKEDSAYPDLTATLGTDWPQAKDATKLREAIDAFYTEIHADGKLKKAVQDQGITNLAFYLNGKR